MRKFLDGIYDAAEWLSMAALAAIGLMVFVQVIGRVADVLLAAFGHPPYGFLVPSLGEIAGFLLVAASFLALAGSLRAGTHIRVSLATASLPENLKRTVELMILAGAALLACYLAYYTAALALDSYRFNERSFGIIAVPLWIPQSAMAAGASIFALALIDDLVVALRGGTQSYLRQESGTEGA